MPGEKIQQPKIGAILLAAGDSSRLGRPKQLLVNHGETFLRHSLNTARGAGLRPIVVVVGAHADAIKEEIEGDDIQIVMNAGWQEGMASSIRAGIDATMSSSPELEGVVLMVCDQPYVNASLLNELVNAYQNTQKHIIASGYANTFGPPVLFHKDLFPELMQLTGDVGARSLIKKHANEAAVLDFPAGSIDVDTESDYQKFADKDPSA